MKAPGKLQQAPAYSEALTHSLLRASSGDPLVQVLLTAGIELYVNSLRAMSVRHEIRSGVNLEGLATALIGVYWSSFCFGIKV
mgnify:CR=1 FL=1